MMLYSNNEKSTVITRIQANLISIPHINPTPKLPQFTFHNISHKQKPSPDCLQCMRYPVKSWSFFWTETGLPDCTEFKINPL